MILRLTLYALAAYLLVAALMFFFQRRLLYLPDLGSQSASFLAAAGLAQWPEPGENYRAYIGISSLNKARGTVIVFHGNAGGAQDRNYYVQALEPLGYRVILAEYPGYGGRSGKPSEKVLAEDARQTISLAEKMYDEPVFLWGESLGSAVVASAIADSGDSIDGIILLTPWDSLGDLAQSIYWFLPARWLLRDRFDSVDNLRSYTGRVALITAGQDQIVPGKHSDRLYNSLNTEKQRWHFEYSGHNSWPVSADENWWAEVMDFVDR